MGTTTVDYNLDTDDSLNQARSDLVPGGQFFVQIELTHGFQLRSVVSPLTGTITPDDLQEQPQQDVASSAITAAPSQNGEEVTTTQLPAQEKPADFFPRTTLARRLWELRQKIVASGEPLLSWDEIERELQERRGEQDFGEDR